MIDELLAYWNRTGASVERLPGGEQKDVWRVATSFALRLYPAFVPASSVQRECRWLTALGREVPEVPVPIPTSNGEPFVEHDGRCAVLAPYVPGDPVADRSRSERRAMAQTLSSIHVAAHRLPRDGEGVHPPLRHLDWETNHWWNLDHVGDVALSRDLWEATRPRLDRLPSWLRSLDGLPEQVVHNDYGVVNVLVNSGRVSAVIDWDWATVDWRLIDVVHAIRTLTGHGLFIENRPAEFIADYRDAGGDITVEELESIPALLNVQATWTALYDLGRANRGQLDPVAARYRVATLRGIDVLAATPTT